MPRKKRRGRPPGSKNEAKSAGSATKMDVAQLTSYIASLQKALDHGADMVEFDVRVTKDGVPVLHHNRNLRDPDGAPRRQEEQGHRHCRGRTRAGWEAGRTRAAPEVCRTGRTRAAWLAGRVARQRP